MNNNNEKLKYEYFRSIDRKDKGNEELFLGYVSIGKYILIYDEEIEGEHRKKLLLKDFALIEEVSKVNPLLLQLPQADVKYELTEFQFSSLLNIYEQDPMSFWLYLSTLSNKRNKNNERPL